MTPIRRDKSDPKADFRHVLRVGSVAAMAILVVASALLAWCDSPERILLP